MALCGVLRCISEKWHKIDETGTRRISRGKYSLLLDLSECQFEHMWLNDRWDDLCHYQMISRSSTEYNLQANLKGMGTDAIFLKAIKLMLSQNIYYKRLFFLSPVVG